ncbi:hypothetical protein AN958_09319 [Leucoagaricus sp. SymC.cos]|nr:hypothetical protein AN958_09319 [Leucoagaricus sp. SymC.cos]
MRPSYAHVLLLLLPPIVSASSGDRRPEFVECVSHCEWRRCPNAAMELAQPWPLRLTRWTCRDECRYECIHSLTEVDNRDGVRIHQYFGKWPFWRLGGIQEPASVLFSLFNMWAHIQGARKIMRRLPHRHPMRSYYLTWSLTSINAWIWSSVFHTRDLPFTEKMDYFSAALAILYALYHTTIRLFHLYSTSPKLTQSSRGSRDWKFYALTLLCSCAFLGHITYLTSLPRFDYTYNMAFNLVVGFLHNLLWLFYSLPSSISLLRRFLSRAKSYRPLFATKAGIFVGLTTAATALELFDFPPWGLVIDAHALWHLVTAPIAYYWYDFLVEDGLDPSWRDQRV